MTARDRFGEQRAWGGRKGGARREGWGWAGARVGGQGQEGLTRS